MFKLFLFSIFVLCICCGCQPPQPNENNPEKPTGVKLKKPSPQKTPTILFFGNSLTAGYGLDISEAFPALIQKRLDSLGFYYKVINAGLSGETTASGRNRIEWVLREEVSILVLELGANDGLRGIDPLETRENLGAIIDIFLDRNPSGKVLLAGMEVPPNMGPDYAANFRVIFEEIATEYNIKLIPFLLEGVGGEEDLNQTDGIHPTSEGHQIVAENVWIVLSSML